ncbi:tRNA (pseudouridine(54)-N(1))-methyltransferase TrmY [Methanolacinia petrolearia]|uniref:tRNA (pseudouridine(54)-N(1))-methyltransferase TrmY n=1 Tax=Methanolacinia petrolearia TaxID=54120 RepID=UPI003BAA445C
MKRFLIIGHKAVTEGGFSLNDMPGGAGRMDVLCRCVNSCFFLSHDLRRDVECYLLLLGEPNPPKTILIKGNEVRYLNPDERSAGSLIKKALQVVCGEEFIESTKDIYIRNGGLERLLNEIDFSVLDENGTDIRSVEEIPENYILSDHMNFSEEEESLIKDLPKISAGPKVLHADHTVIVILNEHDRREK